MRAAIAKRFSGDAAPERLRFFRIQSVSVTRRVLGSAPARGSARVTGRRQPPSSALPPTCIKTVTYFYGQSGLIKILGWCGFIDVFLRSSLFCTQIISLCKNIFRTYSLIEKLCRDCIDIRLLNLHLLRDIKKRSEKSFSNEVRGYCKQNTRLRLAVARDRANLLFCSAHADWLPWLVFTIYFMKMKYQEK